MTNDEVMLKIEHVSKVYKLGEIGGTSLNSELKRVWAKLRKKEDPTKKIGAKNYNKGEKFTALDDISFEVQKGERVGIIGHNGAGKSTLLKLISRVTGPTQGKIYLNGRVASMLEVGTGFHHELTGRENIYMNGAILGMTKKEIDSKIEQIIEFSELRQFIDTPVKRYSSGMYVKLAFSVAAHLDSEIMIMDEVLAVGDVAFQNKCLQKMKDVSEEEDRTILYVSHNMNTIRQLCDRVVVLSKGKIIYQGDVEEGIKFYFNQSQTEEFSTSFDLNVLSRQKNYGRKAKLTSFNINNKQQALFDRNEFLDFSIEIESYINSKKTRLLLVFKDENDIRVGTTMTEEFVLNNGENKKLNLSFDLSFLSYGIYKLGFDLVEIRDDETMVIYDEVDSGALINLVDEYSAGFKWSHRNLGRVRLPLIKTK